MMSRRQLLGTMAVTALTQHGLSNTAAADEDWSKPYRRRAVVIEDVLRRLGLAWNVAAAPSPDACHLVLAVDRVVLGTEMLKEGCDLADVFDDSDPIVPEATLAGLVSERLAGPARIEDVLVNADIIVYDHFVVASEQG